MELMYQHWKLDIEEAKRAANRIKNGQPLDEGEPEYYHDPDFDKEWNADESDEEVPRNIVGESASPTPSEPFKEVAESGGESPTNSHDNEWEEV